MVGVSFVPVATQPGLVLSPKSTDGDGNDVICEGEGFWACMQHRSTHVPVTDVVLQPDQVASIGCCRSGCGFHFDCEHPTIRLLEDDVDFFTPVLGAQVASGGSAGAEGDLRPKLCHHESVDGSAEELAVRDDARRGRSDRRGHDGWVDG